ncbi:hypothetical protein [Chitinophaga sp.]|uniref:hypothetical protein n=1 Tax=Chitinophaga sp. TaxID=1869181 RepID=UPI0031E36BD2
MDEELAVSVTILRIYTGGITWQSAVCEEVCKIDHVTDKELAVSFTIPRIYTGGITW